MGAVVLAPAIPVACGAEWLGVKAAWRWSMVVEVVTKVSVA